MKQPGLAQRRGGRELAVTTSMGPAGEGQLLDFQTGEDREV